MSRLRLTFFLFIIGLFLPLSDVSAFIVLSSHKYAWSNNVGYINFEGVTVEDDALSGHAWSENKGFIKFNPAEGGVLNDGAGNLSGSAWGEQLGWIDFDNVSISGATGKFSGTASGTLVGTITFDCPNFCDVETDWRGDFTSEPESESTEGATSGNRIFSNINLAPFFSSITPPPFFPETGALLANVNIPVFSALAETSERTPAPTLTSAIAEGTPEESIVEEKSEPLPTSSPSWSEKIWHKIVTVFHFLMLPIYAVVNLFSRILSFLGSVLFY